MAKYKVQPGQRFERLTAVSQAGYKVLCRCDCGNVRTVPANNLVNGHTKSCGCLYRETRGTTYLKHSMARSDEHKIWIGMRFRCRNPRARRYEQYGGRGIRVCDRWESFENFYADMGPRPSPTHSLHRLNNDGHYEPGNVVWATLEEQANNKQTSSVLTFKGETMTVTEWARRLGVPRNTLQYRLDRGYSVEDTLSIPIEKGGRVPITER